jgi:hypothetical protein
VAVIKAEINSVDLKVPTSLNVTVTQVYKQPSSSPLKNGILVLPVPSNFRIFKPGEEWVFSLIQVKEKWEIDECLIIVLFRFSLLFHRLTLTSDLGPWEIYVLENLDYTSPNPCLDRPDCPNCKLVEVVCVQVRLLLTPPNFFRLLALRLLFAIKKSAMTWTQ